MFNKIKAWCWHSLTVAWAYLLIAVSVVLEATPLALDLLASPEVSEVLAKWLPAASYSRLTATIGLVTLAARLRSLWNAREA